MDPSYNNSFGTQPTISSGSGDIVLPSVPVKKSKKPLIITLIIIFLSALLGLGVWWYLQQNNQNTIRDTSSFDQYANLLLYGKEDTQKVETFGDFVTSKLNSIAQTDSLKSQQDFIRQIKDVYGNFEQSFQSDDITEKSIINNVKSQLSDLYLYLTASTSLDTVQFDNSQINRIVSLKGIVADSSSDIIDIIEAESEIRQLEYKLFTNLYRSSRAVYNILYDTGETYEN